MRELAKKQLWHKLDQTWRLTVTGGVEKPRWIIIGFQTAKNATQHQDPAAFDHLDLTNAYVTLNFVKFPVKNFNTNFTKNDYWKLYDMFDDFKKDYHEINSLIGGT